MNKIANKVDNTGAFQQISEARQQAIKDITDKTTDARQEAIQEIADAVRDGMVNIQAAAPFPGTTLNLPLHNVTANIGRSTDSAMALNLDTASHSSDVTRLSNSAMATS